MCGQTLASQPDAVFKSIWGSGPRQDDRHLLEFLCCTNLATSTHLGAPPHHVPTPEGNWEPPSLWSFCLVLVLWPGLYRHLLAREETARTRRRAWSIREDKDAIAGFVLDWAGHLGDQMR